MQTACRGERQDVSLGSGKDWLPKRMRVLLYGMQSSGASVLAFTLAQKPESLAFVDIWNMFAAPEIEAAESDIVAKVVVTTAFSLEVHRRRFRPDVTLLVLRHPVDTFYSLSGRSYANENGLIDEKFALLEEVFRAGSGFDHIVHYEDFIFRPRGFVDLADRIGWRIGYDALLLQRAHSDIERTNLARCPGIAERLKYGVGNIHTNSLMRDRVRFSEPWNRTAHLPGLCPSIFAHYASMRMEQGELWNVPSLALLSANLHALLRELAGSEAIPRHAAKFGYKLQFTGGTFQSRIQDAKIVLHPAPRGRETQLMISGLPGRPFNRLRAVFFAEHPLAPGTIARLVIEGTDGQPLAEKELTLCHCDMRNIDLPFEAQTDFLSLKLSLRVAHNGTSPSISGVCIQNLRLEQVAG